MIDITLNQFINAGVHFGHKTSRWNPKMLPYIFTEKNNNHILDLVQSARSLKKATFYLKSAAKKNKKFLFIGTKRQASKIIAEEAERCNSPYVNYKWLGGMLTNWITLKKRINQLKLLEKNKDKGLFFLLSKKEASLQYKELNGLRKKFNGLKNMINLPHVAIVIDQKREKTAVSECIKLGIPIVSILDTNCDPDLIDIPIFGNDDAVGSIKLILVALTDSIIQGQSKFR